MKSACSLVMLCLLAGCTTWVKDEVSHPVSSEAPDYGVVPNNLPRNAQGLPNWALPFIRDFKSYGISAYFEISNTVRTANDRVESKESEPLMVKVAMFAEGANDNILIKDFAGDLSLSPDKVLHPIEMYVYPSTFCAPPVKAGNVDLRKKEITLVRGTTEDRVFRASENFHVTGEKISAVIACVVFKYAEPVPVKNVFTIDFAKVVLADGEVKPLSATFYPVVRDYIEK